MLPIMPASRDKRVHVCDVFASDFLTNTLFG